MTVAIIIVLILLIVIFFDIKSSFKEKRLWAIISLFLYVGALYWGFLVANYMIPVILSIPILLLSKKIKN